MINIFNQSFLIKYKVLCDNRVPISAKVYGEVMVKKKSMNEIRTMINLAIPVNNIFFVLV